MHTTNKPRIAMLLGDPAGIGPELIARLLSDAAANAADVLVIADKAEFENGMQIAGSRIDYVEINNLNEIDFSSGKPLLYDYRGDTQAPFERAVSSSDGGRYCLDTLALAIDLTRNGETDAILFAPLNKKSLHMAGMQHNDELHWIKETLGHTGPCCEFNVLDGLWTSRVTSHIPLKDVAAKITEDGVIEAIRLIDTELRRSGVRAPRIAVCGLNPHNGDNGSFGREEIDIIGPAVERARSMGLPADGPFPADTIFLKVQAERRDYDAVVTMYHDQGQIALKLMGFWRGVTVQGGMPIPITTPAHGTAFDIYGQGRANVGATVQAFELACRMGAAHRAQRKLT